MLLLALLLPLAHADDGGAFHAAGRHEEAIAAWTVAWQQTGDPEILRRKARAFLALGRYEEALWLLQEYLVYTGDTSVQEQIVRLYDLVDPEVLAALVEAGLVEDPPLPPPWAPAEATYRVRLDPEGPATVDVSYRFASVRDGWLEAALVGPGLVVESATGPVTAAPSGVTVVLKPGLRAATMNVRGTLDPDRPGHLSLAVLPAARQRVIVEAPGLDVDVLGAVDGHLSAADRLDLSFRPREARVPEAPRLLVTAERAVAAWGSEGALEVRGVLRWKVLRGAATRFTVDVAGLTEVDVAGANVSRWSRAGDVVTIEPREPVKGTLQVTLSARAALPAEGEMELPAPRPLEVQRVDGWYTLGRSDEGELIPVAGPPTVTARALPEWARGLSEGTPVAFWHGEAPVRVRAARFTPLMGPDTVIEQADFVLATSREGRVLVRATWQVRNERRQYLHLRPPPGFRALTARVSGTPVTPLSDGAAGIYVPLEKSVETVQGLLTFPVEVTWVATEAAWEGKGERTLTLPAVDAPIQAASWELHLPRGVSSPDASGTAEVVELDIEDDPSQQAWLKAVSSYKANDFDEAQQYLDQARSLGSTDQNIDRLQSNLDVLIGEDTKSDAPEDVATRRVRELANAKTVQMQVVQEKKADEADEAMRQGDVDKAAELYEEVAELAKDIGVTEQKESEEQKVRYEAASSSAAMAKAEKKKRESADDGDRRDAAGSFGVLGAKGTGSGGGGYGVGGGGTAEGLGGYGSRSGPIGDPVTIDFEDISIAGELSTPSTATEAPPAAFGSMIGFDGVPPAGAEEATGIALGTLGYVEGGEVVGGVGGQLGGVTGETAAGVASSSSENVYLYDEDADAVADEEDFDGEPEAAPEPAEAVRRTYSSVTASVPGRSSGRGAGRGSSPSTGKAQAGKGAPRPAASAPPPPPPPQEAPARGPAPPAQKPISIETASTVDGDFLQRIPAGRSYQQVVEESSGAMRPPAEPSPVHVDTPAAPPVRDTRAPLEVRATPLTVAMPLAGATVRSDQALLPADVFPTLTVPYRTPRGAPK